MKPQEEQQRMDPYSTDRLKTRVQSRIYPRIKGHMTNHYTTKCEITLAESHTHNYTYTVHTQTYST